MKKIVLELIAVLILALSLEFVLSSCNAQHPYEWTDAAFSSHVGCAEYGEA